MDILIYLNQRQDYCANLHINCIICVKEHNSLCDKRLGRYYSFYKIKK